MTIFQRSQQTSKSFGISSFQVHWK